MKRLIVIMTALFIVAGNAGAQTPPRADDELKRVIDLLQKFDGRMDEMDHHAKERNQKFDGRMDELDHRAKEFKAQVDEFKSRVDALVAARQNPSTSAVRSGVDSKELLEAVTKLAAAMERLVAAVQEKGRMTHEQPRETAARSREAEAKRVDSLSGQVAALKQGQKKIERILQTKPDRADVEKLANSDSKMDEMMKRIAAMQQEDDAKRRAQIAAQQQEDDAKKRMQALAELEERAKERKRIDDLEERAKERKRIDERAAAYARQLLAPPRMVQPPPYQRPSVTYFYRDAYGRLYSFRAP